LFYDVAAVFNRRAGEASARIHMQFFATVFACNFAAVAPARHPATADWAPNRGEFTPKVVAGSLLHCPFFRRALFYIGESIV
jgi:hypothetical protein